MTSNVGSEHILDGEPNKVLDELHNYFKPEFINRVDDVVVFNKLSPEVLKEIVKKMLLDLIN